MRTNIVIDDELMAAAMEAGGFRTKKDAVEEGLRLLARRAAYQNIRAARGTLQWDDGSGGRPTVAPGLAVQEAAPGDAWQWKKTKAAPARKAPRK